MNTGHSSKSYASQTFPFTAEVYRTAEPDAPRNGELEELRAEMRNALHALRAQVTRASGGGDLGRELAAMRAALEEMAPVPTTPKRNDREAALLRARGIEGPAARRITARAKEAPHGKESGQGDVSARVKSAIAMLVTLAPWDDQSEGRRIVALVGPSGVGKTTTIAKMAVQALMNGKSVALVSCDGFRVGAVDQLERYADLLGATFHVARTASELARVLEEETADLVFVDTSGRPPTATAPEAALAARRKRGAPVPVDVILCMPASIRPADAVRVVAVFAPLTPTAMCITKLDETKAPSGLVHGPWAAKLPLAIMCAGPRVPEDISPATHGAFFAALAIEEPVK